MTAVPSRSRPRSARCSLCGIWRPKRDMITVGEIGPLASYAILYRFWECRRHSAMQQRRKRQQLVKKIAGWEEVDPAMRQRWIAELEGIE